MRLKVYIAGPYTYPNVEENVANAIRVANQLMDLGVDVFVPHLFYYCDKQAPRSYDRWLDTTMSWMRRCDVVFRMAGESDGAQKEVDEARQLGISVFTEFHNLLTFCEGYEKGAGIVSNKYLQARE